MPGTKSIQSDQLPRLVKSFDCLNLGVYLIDAFAIRHGGSNVKFFVKLSPAFTFKDFKKSFLFKLLKVETGFNGF